MKVLLASNSRETILKTLPIISNVDDWFFKFEEVSNSVFVVEAIDLFGRIFSKIGTDPTSLQKEIEEEIKLALKVN